ncbi:virion structural protein [Betalipothrixvirus uzonense]|uniref:Viral structural protein n=1 Tax=Betalipothrixvirus uzonense TaxID=512792 RepID=B2CRL0_9VIRU|nr:virion structural protein [Acidianus filamentous virus 9]ACB37267.1 viral structural protein [Acidianus filamentous virus 9]
MAGRQAHRKFDIRKTTAGRYKGKMFGILQNYMGEKYAEEVAENMYSDYKEIFENIYTKIHDALRNKLASLAGSGSTFPLWQIINEAIYAVYLTHKETASFLVTKFLARGIPADVTRTILADVGNQLKNLVPFVAQQLGEVELTPANVVRVVDDIVIKNPSLPNSFAGTALKSATPTPPPHYAGTPTFSSMESGYKALEDIERGL